MIITPIKESFNVEVSLEELVLLSSAIRARLLKYLEIDSSLPIVSQYRKLDVLFNDFLDPLLLNDFFKTVPK